MLDYIAIYFTISCLPSINLSQEDEFEAERKDFWTKKFKLSFYGVEIIYIFHNAFCRKVLTVHIGNLKSSPICSEFVNPLNMSVLKQRE